LDAREISFSLRGNPGTEKGVSLWELTPKSDFSKKRLSPFRRFYAARLAPSSAPRIYKGFVVLVCRPINSLVGAAEKKYLKRPSRLAKWPVPFSAACFHQPAHGQGLFFFSKAPFSSILEGKFCDCTAEFEGAPLSIAIKKHTQILGHFFEVSLT
jgi:hypothetical protein